MSLGNSVVDSTSVWNKLSRVSEHFKNMENAWDYYLVGLRLKDSALIRFRDGNRLWVGVKGNKFWVKVCHSEFLLNRIGEIGPITEMYFQRVYQDLNCRGKTVVDIGCNIGDSLVWFMQEQGAKKIIAFEPYPYVFALSAGNVWLNGIHSKVVLRFAAVEGKAGKIHLNTGCTYPASKLEETKDGREVEITTLSQIVKQYKLKDAFLKMDCEGSEYGIFENTSKKDLRAFKEIILEFHAESKPIEDKLKACGFKVKIVRPTVLLAVRVGK